MNDYLRNEQKGRDLFTKYYEFLGFSKPTYSTNNYEIFDAKTLESLVEIKVRTMPFSRFKDVILEVKKARALYTKSNNLSIGAYYVMFFTDDIVAVVDIYKLTKENTNPQSKYAAVSSCENKGSIEKQMFILKEEHIAVKLYKLS